MTKVDGFNKRVDAISQKPEEEVAYKTGFLDGQRESWQFYHNLPYLFQQTIMEYLRSPERYQTGLGQNNPKTREEASKWFAGIIEKETELHAELDGFFGKDSTMYKCPLCGVEYFSSLLAAFHMFDNHIITTSR